MLGMMEESQRATKSASSERRTNTEGPNEDADDVGITRFLDNRVAAHEELVRPSGL